MDLFSVALSATQIRGDVGGVHGVEDTKTSTKNEPFQTWLRLARCVVCRTSNRPIAISKPNEKEKDLAMKLRPLKERIIQSLGYEIGALLFMVPAYHWATKSRVDESLSLLLLLSATVLIVSPLHNMIFDWVEGIATKRLASDRTPFWRTVHATSHELWAVAATLPIIVHVTGHGLRDALILDVALTLAYTVYAYGYYWMFDRLCPMAQKSPV